MKTIRESIAALGVLFTVGVVAIFYARLPETIATHFNAAGVADGFGGRAILWLLAANAVFVYGVMSAVPFLPLKVNLLRPLTSEQESAARVGALALVGWLKVEIVLTLGYVCLAIVRIGLGLQWTLGSAFLPATLIVIGATCGYHFVQMMRATRVHG
ncbi:DUF1648 domain-containing protein [Tunturiibacter lichenicola]|uniref:DUF1648 domain-containing protein n=1 Tax=Tunturiibacter lichenicola TaxID=2051959 RepID=UPI0021B1957A|nr:DUF1648 domain-containing protein [Edaphobacter lichenicola]